MLGDEQRDDGGDGQDDQDAVQTVPPRRPVAFHAVFGMLGDHLQQEDEGTCHIDDLYPNVVNVAGLQEDDNGVQQDDAEYEFLVEKQIFHSAPVLLTANC